MILYLQLILIGVLALILAALYLDEKQKRENKIPKGRLTEVWNGGERRRFTRISCTVSVRYCPPPRRQNNIKVVDAKDISLGGICMTISEKLSPRTKLYLEINCGAAATPISANGEVVWIKEVAEKKNQEGIRYFNVGIEFKDMLHSERERLFQFIKKSASTQDG